MAMKTKIVSENLSEKANRPSYSKCCKSSTFLIFIVVIVFSLIKQYSHELSQLFWTGINRYHHLLDHRIDECFEEIPKVSKLFAQRGHPDVISCPVGSEPKPRLDVSSKMSTIVQYSFAPNVKPFSNNCKSYATELHSPKKTLSNLYDLYKLWTMTKANTEEEFNFHLDTLPKVQLRQALMKLENFNKSVGNDGNVGTGVISDPIGVPAEVAATRQFFNRKKKGKSRRSVLMALFDALGRANYERLLSPSIKELMEELKIMSKGKDGKEDDGDGGDYYNLFDFSRFHVVAKNSKRNYNAVYTGHIPELFDGIKTGKTKPVYLDKDTCVPEIEDILSYNNKTAIDRLARRCQRTIWGTYRDNGYLTADLGVAKADSLAEYFDKCDKSCGNESYSNLWGNDDSNADLGLGPLISALPPENMSSWNRAKESLHAMAGTFHSLALKGGPPIFATQQSLDTHNKLQDVGSSAFIVRGFIKALRAIAMKNNVPLPLLVLHADHGAHYGGIQLTKAGRIEHKFGMLIILVPERLLIKKPNMRSTLKTNSDRLVSAFDLHHTMLEFAKVDKKVGKEKMGQDEAELAGIDKFNIFNQVVPVDRKCSNAGIENFLCICDKWYAIKKEELPVLNYLSTSIVMPLLNKRLGEMLLKEKKSITKQCARIFLFKTLYDAEGSSNPSSLKYVLKVTAASNGSREILFSVSLLCKDETTCNLRHGRCIGGERFIPKMSSTCTVAAIDRITSMSNVENKVYKAAGKSSIGGKLCVVP
jgi:hypothetical protein